MKVSLPKRDLVAYVQTLVEQQFPDGGRHDYEQVLDRALDRVEYCFSRIALRGYRDAAGATFDHLHGDQSAAFFYFLANCAWRDFDDATLAKKFTQLNRARNALLVMYDTQLPDIFVIPHTVGTVIGKGQYANYLVVCQNVTIANDIATTLTFEPGVILFPGAFVVGTGTIGTGSVITANTTLQYRDVPPNSMVSGRSPAIEFRPRKKDFLSRFFLPPYPGYEETVS